MVVSNNLVLHDVRDLNEREQAIREMVRVLEWELSVDSFADLLVRVGEDPYLG